MTDSIFAKIILSVAGILTVLTGSTYIKVAESELTFDFKTGNLSPIYYYLNVENVGPQKARFDASTNAGWLYVYREGSQGQTDFTSLELPAYAPINFVLEVHPERLEDKVHEAEVLINVIQLQDYSVLDSKKITVTLNKNIQVTPLPVPPPPEVEVSISPSPPATAAPQPKATVKPIVSASPKIESALPAPEAAPVPVSEKVSPLIRPLQQLIESLRSLVRFLFR